MRRHYPDPRNGFSLLEIAIVLMIGGLIFGTALSLFRPIQAMQSNAMTRQRVERVMNAISTYALQQNALPCPGQPDAVPPGKPGDAPKSCAGGPNAAVWGIIPYAALGLAQTDVIDGSGHYMTYVVPRILTKPAGNASTDGPMTGLFKGNPASRFCDTTPGGQASLPAKQMLSINRPDQKIVEPHIAVAIIAYGNDGFGAYNLGMADPKQRRCPVGMSGCRLPAPGGDCAANSGPLDRMLGKKSGERGNAVDHADCRNNNTLYVSGYSGQAGANHFDDQVTYATGKGLISRLGMAGCSP